MKQNMLKNITKIFCWATEEGKPEELRKKDGTEIFGILLILL